MANLFPEIKVIRSRDADVLKDVDARVDVGKKHDHSTLDYDHHQQGVRHRIDGEAINPGAASRG